MRKKVIVFDLDGTLLDTLDDLTASVNFALEQFNYPIKDREYVRCAIGNGVQKLIARCLPNKEETKDYNDVLSLFTKHYSEHYNINTKPYKNMLETLKRLKGEGYILCVTTNKVDKIAKDLINHYFPSLFSIIQGDEASLKKKPHPDMMDKIVNQLSVQKEDVLYIGDTNVDDEFAFNSKVDCLLVTYGYRKKEEMKIYHLNYPLIDNIDDIFLYLK